MYIFDIVEIVQYSLLYLQITYLSFIQLKYLSCRYLKLDRGFSTISNLIHYISPLTYDLLTEYSLEYQQSITSLFLYLTKLFHLYRLVTLVIENI